MSSVYLTKVVQNSVFLRASMSLESTLRDFQLLVCVERHLLVDVITKVSCSSESQF